MIAFAAIIIGIVLVMTVIDRTVFKPLARAKNIDNDQDIKRNGEMADTFGIAAIIIALILIFLAAK